jgi:dihydroneopterin aldolase/2-amino-4-hydroxy-6-hydroxymethyldihydropteridine diphosphokinase
MDLDPAYERAMNKTVDAQNARVFVAVGSNVDPTSNVLCALERLDADVGVARVSTFYRTPALDRPDDPPFVNGVVEVEARLPAYDVKRALRRIEEALGRTRTGDRYAPRTIDLDLLLYGDEVSIEPGLPLPHPDVRTRPFVAVPLAELAPDLILPDSGTRTSVVAASLRPSAMEPLPELTQELRRRFPHGHGEGRVAGTGAPAGAR